MLKFYVNLFLAIYPNLDKQCYSVAKIIDKLLASNNDFNLPKLYNALLKYQNKLKKVKTLEGFKTNLLEVIDEVKLDELLEVEYPDYLRMHPEFHYMEFEEFKNSYLKYKKNHKNLSFDQCILTFKNYPFLTKIYCLVYSNSDDFENDKMNFLDQVIYSVQQKHNNYNLENLYNSLVKFLDNTKIILTPQNFLTTLELVASQKLPEDLVLDYNCIEHEPLIAEDYEDIESTRSLMYLINLYNNHTQSGRNIVNMVGNSWILNELAQKIQNDHFDLQEYFQTQDFQDAKKSFLRYFLNPANKKFDDLNMITEILSFIVLFHCNTISCYNLTKQILENLHPTSMLQEKDIEHIKQRSNECNNIFTCTV